MPVLKKLTDAYKTWHETFIKFPRPSRYTLGAKIDLLFTKTLESILIAGYSGRDQKLSRAQQASAELDSLKYFLRVAWELKILDHKKYATLASPLNEVGRMLGGWHKQLLKP